uniref:HNH nuclease domain-containing protein n=1 Tax=Physcomitrium patens TaxID=3218 RepID=A0A7I4DNB1_PHYPA
MSLTKSQIFHAHSNCKHLPLERECLQRHSIYSVIASSFHVGNLKGPSRKRSVVARFVMSSRAQAKRPAHHGKSKKDSKEQRGKILKNTKKVDSSGLMLTDSLAIGNSSLAPADFCSMEEELDELDEDDELQIYRGLVLDLTYRPINVVSWKRALCLDVMERADVLEYYDQAVVAVSKSYYIPAVLRVSTFVHAPKGKKVKLTLNRNNIFLRDKFRCQYCNKRGEDLTVDHVLAASRGGGWEWENLVIVQYVIAIHYNISTCSFFWLDY